MICPYCYARHAADDLLMSCGPSCSPPAVFPAKSLHRNRCAHGRLPRARRVCPSCSRPVPREYAEAPGRSILVTGTGKSTWLTSVVHHLSTGEIVPGLSVRLLGDSSRARYADLRARSVEPILLSLRRAGASPAVLALYELSDVCPPGLLASAAGVVRLIDPVELPRVRQLLNRPPEPPSSVPERPHPIPAAPPALDWPTHLPMALAVTKLDLVWDMFDHGSPLRRLTPPTSAYLESDGLDVHHEVAAWLDRWGDLPAAQRCFALSPHAAGYRVADPLLWLLTRFGAFGVRS
ncbi:MAG TPA: hypothetical protein VF821_00680 [Lentzea sp.]